MDKIVLGDSLSQDQVDIIKDLCKKFEGIFQKPTVNDKCKNLGFVAELRLNEPPKFVARPRMMHPAQRAALSILIKDQLQKGIIKHSKSATTSPALLVPKPGGKWRFCVDYSKLNAITESDAYSVPRIDSYFAALGGNKFFTSLDLIDAFWSIPLAEKSQPLTAFSCADGLYEYLRMPQGIKQGPAIFSRFMDEVFGSLKWVTNSRELH